MNRNSLAHSGQLITASGDVLEVDLAVIGGSTLRMSAAGDELGTWPLAEFRIDPGRDSSYRIAVDGEAATFTPADPGGFVEFVRSLAPPGREDGPGVPEVEEIRLGVFDDSESSDAKSDETFRFLFGSSARQSDVATIELGDGHTEEPSGTGGREGRPPPADVSIENGLVEAEPVDVVEVPSLEPPVSDDAVEPPDPEVDVPSIEVSDGAVESPDVGLLDDALSVEQPGPPSANIHPPRVDPVSALADDELAAVLSDWGAASDGDDDPSLDTLEGDAGAVEIDDEDAAQLRSRLGRSSVERFSAAIETRATRSPELGAEEYELGPNTVADDVVASQRILREHQQKTVITSSRLRNTFIGLGVASVIVVLALLAPGAMEFLRTYEGGPELPPTIPVVATTVVITTTLPTAPDEPPPTTIPIPSVGNSIFDAPVADFVARWNSNAVDIDRSLALGPLPPEGPFDEPFTPYLRMVGEVRPDGTMSEFALIIDPSGPAQYDRIGIQALGVAIATVDPSRSPEGRAALLGNLGLNVRRPMLGAIDGRLESNGLSYTLMYDAEVSLLTLTVSPVG